MPLPPLPLDGDNWETNQAKYNAAIQAAYTLAEQALTAINLLKGDATASLPTIIASVETATQKAEGADDKATQAQGALADKVEKTAIDADGNAIIDESALPPVWFDIDIAGSGTEADPYRFQPPAGTQTYRDSVLVKKPRMLFYNTTATATDGSGPGVLQFWNGTTWKNLY